MDSLVFLWVLLLANLLVLVLVLALWRKQTGNDSGAAEEANQVNQLALNLQAANERLERELRNAISESARGGRQELIQTLGTFQQSLVQQSAEATRTQNLSLIHI